MPFLARLVRAKKGKQLVLGADIGLDAACRALMRLICESLPSADSNGLSQMDLTLSGMLAAAASPRSPEDENPPSALQMSHLQRICSQVESRLSDPALALKDVVAAEKYRRAICRSCSHRTILPPAIMGSVALSGPVSL